MGGKPTKPTKSSTGLLAPKPKWAKGNTIAPQRRTKASADAIREYRRNRYRNDVEFAAKSREASKLRQRKVELGEIPRKIARPFQEEGNTYYKLSYLLFTFNIPKARFNKDCINGVIPPHTYPLISRVYNETQFKLMRSYYKKTTQVERERYIPKLHKNWTKGDYNDGS